MDPRIRPCHLLLLGQPAAHGVRTSKAVRSVQLFLEGRQRRRGKALVDGGPGHLRAEGTVSTARGIGPEPGGHAVPRSPQQRGHLWALVRLAAGGEGQRLEPLPLLPLGFACRQPETILCEGINRLVSDSERLRSMTNFPYMQLGL
jgi:hypothetical protein